MKKLMIFLCFLSILSLSSSAQETKSAEKHGKALNLGVGIGGYYGYYGYVGHSMPILHVDYEFDVAKNFTLAPFIGFYSYQNSYYWGSKNYPYRYYSFRETVIPIGVKGTYYFDQLFQANSKWDFYLAGSLGFALENSRWESGYYGDQNYYHSANPFFMDIHIGTEYHINTKIGLFFDLSTGVSTIGLAIR